MTSAEDDAAAVAIQFGIAPAAALQSPAGQAASGTTTAARASAEAADELLIQGSNGTLLITDVQFIVTEFELKRDGDACEGVEDEDACEEFEAPPSLVDLPLSGGAVRVATEDVPTGLYEELKFEVSDLDLDDAFDAERDDDDAEDAALSALATQIRAAFPRWPEDASLVVSGTFTPTGGEARPFVTFVDAEIEVELEFEPALALGDAGAQVLTVDVDPTRWFALGDGRVLDLTAFDVDRGGDLLELEVELEQGFTKIKLDDWEDEDERDEEDDD